MLIDDVTIKIASGHGGRGAVAFNTNKMSLGPTGASGGKGGDFYFEGSSDLSLLNQFRFRKELRAEDGENGKKQFRDGADGKDLILKIPVGTVIHNLTSGQDTEITKVGERILNAKGGKGGRGNFHFKSSRNTSPTQFQSGLPGEEFEIRLELKLIADVGIIGLPNAGKSSLLNVLTRARSKVARYPFTTLEPSLGVYNDVILADIPGLIEGASSGKGLDLIFLKHIERTTIFIHLISIESENLVHDYQTIRNELEKYNPNLLKKDEYLFLSKSDLLTNKDIEKKLKELKKIQPNIEAISIHDLPSLSKIKALLNKINAEKIQPPVE